MNYIVFDIETKNTFDDVGSGNPADLDISVVSVFNAKDGSMKTFMEKDFGEMWPIFEQTNAIIGFNSEHFDLPLIEKYYGKTLPRSKSIDLMKSVKDSFGKRIKLDTIAEATLGRKKIGHGLDAIKWWNSGEIDKIIKYCEEDVLITRDVFLYALNNGKLKIKDLTGNSIDIPIDNSTWKKIIEEESIHDVTQGLF